MNNGFWSAITGAKSYQTAVDTTANNIANINTTGYRGTGIEFGTLYERFLAVNANTLTSNQGLGVRVQATALDMRSGSYQQTDNSFDFAISGDGWFGTVSTNPYDAKKVAYTRAGNFSRDANGTLVTRNGNFVLGTSYGNMIYENGAWRIDNSVDTNGLKPVAQQGTLTIPENLIFPPIATKNATLVANLPNVAGASSAAARKNAAITELNYPLGINAGSTMLIASGDQVGLTRADEQDEILQLTKPITGISSPLILNINGSVVNAIWAADADAATIGTAIMTAINDSGAARASYEDGKLTIRAENRLTITGGENTVFAPISAEILTISNTTTVAEVGSAIENSLKTTYGDDPILTYKYDGSLVVTATGPINLKVGSDNEALNKIFATFDGSLQRIYLSEEFKEASRTAEQKIIAPNGDILTLESTVRSAGAGFVADTRIKQKVVADGSIDMANLIGLDGALGLRGGENIWASFGKPPEKTNTGYGYLLLFGNDIPDGVAPTISFTIDGQQLSLTGTDGDMVSDLRSDFAALLAQNGYETGGTGGELIIYPKGESLTITNGASNIESMRIDSASFGRIIYETGDTVSAFLAKANLLANAVGSNIAINDGKIAISDQNNIILAANFYKAENTPDALFALFSPLAFTLSGGGRKTTDALEGFRVISEVKNTAIAEDTPATITLENGGVPLSFTIDVEAVVAQANTVAIRADGVREGRLESYGSGSHGEIIANFDNGRQTKIAQLAVYQFANDQGLMRIGDTAFMQSENSGEPFFWLDAFGNLRTSVTGNMLENSNVDSARALTDLIIYQRAYEGNAKAITTNDQLIQNAIGLKR